MLFVSLSRERDKVCDHLEQEVMGYKKEENLINEQRDSVIYISKLDVYMCVNELFVLNELSPMDQLY